MTTTRKRAATPAARTDLLDRFVSFPSRVEAAIRTAAPRPPIDGEWTPQQVVRHLIAVERVVHQARLLDLAVVDGPVWTWTEPGPWEGEPDLGLDGVLARYAELRADTVARIRALDEEGWGRAGTHATYGKLDVAGLLELATAHDDEHLQGLEAR